MELNDFLNEDEVFKNLCKSDEQRENSFNAVYDYINGNEDTVENDSLLKNFLETKNSELKEIIEESKEDEFLKYIGAKVLANSYIEQLRYGSLNKNLPLVDKAIKKQKANLLSQDNVNTLVKNICEVAAKKSMPKAKKNFDKEHQKFMVVKTMNNGNSQSSSGSLSIKDINEIKKSSMLNIEKILELTGHFQQTFKHKLRTQSKSIESIVGTTIGNDLPNVLNSELALMVDDDFRSLKELEFVQKNLFQYKFKGKSSSTEGNIVVCVDESSSMNDYNQSILKAKAFVCGLYEQAKSENREMNVISFCEYAKGPLTIHNPKELLEWSGTFMNGNTNFYEPLKKAMDIIDKNKDFERADIIFITDGCSKIEKRFKQDFLEWKNKRNIKLITLNLDSNYDNYELKEISNAMINGNNFDELVNLI